MSVSISLKSEMKNCVKLVIERCKEQGRLRRPRKEWVNKIKNRKELETWASDGSGCRVYSLYSATFYCPSKRRGRSRYKCVSMRMWECLCCFGFDFVVWCVGKVKWAKRNCIWDARWFERHKLAYGCSWCQFRRWVLTASVDLSCVDLCLIGERKRGREKEGEGKRKQKGRKRSQLACVVPFCLLHPLVIRVNTRLKCIAGLVVLPLTGHSHERRKFITRAQSNAVQCHELAVALLLLFLFLHPYKLSLSLSLSLSRSLL